MAIDIDLKSPSVSITGSAKREQKDLEKQRSISIFGNLMQRAGGLFQRFAPSLPASAVAQALPSAVKEPVITQEINMKNQQREALYLTCESAAINDSCERVLWLHALKALGGPSDLIELLKHREDIRYAHRGIEFNREYPNYLSKHFRKYGVGKGWDIEKVLINYQLILMQHLSIRSELFKRLKFDETIASGVIRFYRNELMQDIKWVDAALQKIKGPAPIVTPLPARIEVGSRARFLLELKNAFLQDYQNRLAWLNSAWIEEDSPTKSVTIELFIDDENAFYDNETRKFKEIHNDLFREIESKKIPSSICETTEHFFSTYRTMLEQQFESRNELIDRIVCENSDMGQHIPELKVENRKLLEGQLLRFERLSRQRKEYENESILKNAALQAHRNRLQWLQSVEIGNDILKKPELLQECVCEEKTRYRGLELSFKSYLRGFDCVILEPSPKTYYETTEDFIQSYLNWIQTQQKQRHDMIQEIVRLDPNFAQRADELIRENEFESEQLQSWVIKAAPSIELPVLQNTVAQQPKAESKNRFSLSRLGLMGALGFAGYQFGSKIPHHLPHITTQAPVFLSYWSDKIVNTIDKNRIAQFAENVMPKFSLEGITLKVKNIIQSDPNMLAYAVGALALIATVGQYFIKKS